MKLFNSLSLLLVIGLSNASAKSFRGSVGKEQDENLKQHRRILVTDGYELIEATPEGGTPTSTQKASHGSDTSKVPIKDYGQGFDPDFEAEPTSATPPKGGNTKVIVGDDDRYIFRNTSFPYRAVGRLYNEAGNFWCTGTMVGRNIMLTNQHCVKFNSNGTFKDFKFSPAYYDGAAPFGTASATNVYYWKRVDIKVGSSYEDVANDYVIVVLDKPLGEASGYLGFVTFDDSWKDQNVWDSIGYPGDLGGGKKTVFIPDGAVKSVESYEEGKVKMLEHNLDFISGQSGSPLFAKFGSDVKLVGILSSHDGPDADEWNYAAGGSKLSDLIAWGRSQHP